MGDLFKIIMCCWSYSARFPLVAGLPVVRWILFYFCFIWFPCLLPNWDVIGFFVLWLVFVVMVLFSFLGRSLKYVLVCLGSLMLFFIVAGSWHCFCILGLCL